MSVLASQMARLAAGISTVFGTSWLLALAFDKYLTQLLVDATIRTLNDPVVEEEVYQLFRKLLPALLEDEKIRARAPGFLKEVMSQEIFEEAANVLLSGAVESESYRKKAMGLMQFISSRILSNEDLETKIAKATQDVVGAVRRAAEIPRHVPIYRYKLPHFQEIPVSMAAPTPDFSASVSAFSHTLLQFELQEQAHRLREQAQRMISAPSLSQTFAVEISMPQIDIGPQMAAICAGEIPMQQEMEANRLLAQIQSFELQPPQPFEPSPPPPIAPPLSLLDQNETHYLTY